VSQENIEIVRRIYEAMNAGDVAGATELVHPDAEWIPDSRVGEGPVRGRENVIRFFTDRAEVFDQLDAEAERFWDKDDKVLVFVRVTGRGQASGADFEIRIGHLWTVRDGLVVRGEGYGDRSEALEAAGVSE
jgi:ketosteroid isomerase-like protein